MDIELFAHQLAGTSEQVAAATRAAVDERRTIEQNPLVLFGAGGRGKKILEGLRTLKRVPVAFTDNDSALWGKAIAGVLVISPEEAARKFSAAVFIVTIWSDRIGHPFDSVRKQLEAYGVSQVRSFTTLYNLFPDTFFPDFFLDRPDKLLVSLNEIRTGMGLWHDEYSKDEYASQVQMRFTLNLERCQRMVGYTPYFPKDLFTIISDDNVFVDCGAFDGDTTRNFLEEVDHRFAKIIAFEPDPHNFSKLESMLTQWPSHHGKIVPMNIAVGRISGSVRFAPSFSPESHIDENGEVEVPIRSLDSILEAEHPTYIKLDIEGAEMEAIMGARNTILRSRPVIAVAVYHKPGHLWEIPILLSQIASDYVFYLRPEKRAGWDLTCYAVPKERSLLHP